MKILVLNATNPATLGGSYARAFRALGHEVVQFAPVELLGRAPLYRNRHSRRILERALLWRHTGAVLERLVAEDADMIWVGKGQWALPRLWQAFKAARPGTTLV